MNPTFRTLCGLLLAGPLFLPLAGALAEMTPEEVMLEMFLRDDLRGQGVNQIYSKYLTKDIPTFSEIDADADAYDERINDYNVGLLREKVYCTDSRNDRDYVWRIVPPEELEARQSQYSESGLLREIADRTRAAGDMFNAGLRQEGVPVDLIASLNPEPWSDGESSFNMMDPGDYAAGYGIFFDSMADTIDRARSAQRGIKACNQVHAKRKLKSSVRSLGQQTIHGKTAHVVQVPDIDSTQEMEDGSQFRLRTATAYIDAQEFVPLRFTYDGVVVAPDGESRPIAIERDSLDYRRVPGSQLYEPYREVMRIKGFMALGPEAEEAQRQLAEMEAQLAALPADQRAMVEGMMGQQLQMVRQMASTGDIEYEREIVEIIVNPGIPGGPGEAVVEPEKPLAHLPYYIDDEGVGILRYTQSGQAAPLYLEIARNDGQPLALDLGPYDTPNIAVYIGSLKALGVSHDDVELMLFRKDPTQIVARFRPVVDASKAEGLAECGTVAPSGACSNTAN